MKKLISLFLLFAMALSFSSCKAKTRSRTVSSLYFNTVSVISTYADKSDRNIEKYVETADELLSYYHNLFDIYHDYSGINNIKTINDNAGKSPVKVDQELIVFLNFCKGLFGLTRGNTNIMLGSVLKLWHNAREQAEDDFGFIPESELPTADELTEAKKHTSIDLLVIDEEASTVYITDPLASIDVGAIAKGYAVDRLYDKLKAEGADSVAINVGGNVRTIGLKPDGEKWVSGITNPNLNSDDALISRVRIGETSIVTSGDYERYFYSGDKRYHHIIDPETLYPADYFSSVSIICENSALADALSTALFCMSYEDGMYLLESIESPSVEVIWIDKEYKIKTTDGVELIPMD